MLVSFMQIISFFCLKIFHDYAPFHCCLKPDIFSEQDIFWVELNKNALHRALTQTVDKSTVGFFFSFLSGCHQLPSHLFVKHSTCRVVLWCCLSLLDRGPYIMFFPLWYESTSWFDDCRFNPTEIYMTLKDQLISWKLLLGVSHVSQVWAD